MFRLRTTKMLRDSFSEMLVTIGVSYKGARYLANLITRNEFSDVRDRVYDYLRNQYEETIKTQSHQSGASS